MKKHFIFAAIITGSSLFAEHVPIYELECTTKVQSVNLKLNYKVMYEKTDAGQWQGFQRVSVTAAGEKPNPQSSFTADTVNQMILGGPAFSVTFDVDTKSLTNENGQGIDYQVQIPKSPLIKDLNQSPRNTVNAPGEVLTTRFKTEDGREFILTGTFHGKATTVAATQSGFEYSKKMNARFYRFGKDGQQIANLGGYGETYVSNGDPFGIVAANGGSFELDCKLADRLVLLKCNNR